MADEDTEVQEPGVEETEDAVVIDTAVRGKPDDDKGSDVSVEASEEKETEEKTEEEVEEKKEEPKEERVDFSAELEKAKRELREELQPEKAKEEKKIYTKEELRNYRRQVEQKREDGEINNAQYLAYLEQIDDLNEERIRYDLARETDRRSTRQRAEQNVEFWATQNAPDLLDGRTKRSKESTEFARRELGAVLENGNWVIPENVGRVLFGLAYGTQDETANKIKEAEAKGREQALKEKEVRERDLGNIDKPPKSGTGKAAKPAIPEVANEVKARLDLTPRQMKTYLKLRGSKKSGTVEVLQ